MVNSERKEGGGAGERRKEFLIGNLSDQRLVIGEDGDRTTLQENQKWRIAR